MIGALEAEAIQDAIARGEDLLSLKLPLKLPGGAGHESKSLKELHTSDLFNRGK